MFIKLVALSVLLVLASSIEDDFGGQDVSRYAKMLRDQGFTEKEIAELLQEDEDDREKLDEEDDSYSWSEANGYDDCKDPEFMCWREGSEDEVLRNKRHHGSNHMEKDVSCPKPKPLSKICAKYDCPKIEHLNISGCGFEARKLFAASWVLTDIDLSGSMEAGYKAAFWKLFKYINGANDQGVKIDMTVPVVNRWHMNDKYEVLGADMAFYIPSVHQSNPPVPTDDSVTIENWDDAIIYDRAFGGHRTDEAFYKKEFELLWKALFKENITPYTKMAITAGYTRPGWGRQRNEVMYVDQDSV